MNYSKTHGFVFVKRTSPANLSKGAVIPFVAPNRVIMRNITYAHDRKMKQRKELEEMGRRNVMRQKIDDMDSRIKRAMPKIVSLEKAVVKAHFKQTLCLHRFSVTTRSILVAGGESQVSCSAIFPVIYKGLFGKEIDHPTMRLFTVQSMHYGIIVICFGKFPLMDCKFEDNDLILMFKNKGSKKQIFQINLIPCDTDCKGCGKAQGRKKFRRCKCCWEKLHMPVWYCSSGCQKEHWPRHKSICGDKYF